jgi:excisionase family DNA binding protein
MRTTASAILAATVGYCRVPRAARVLGVSPGTIRRLIRQQRLGGVKYHGTWLIRKGDLKAFGDHYSRTQKSSQKPWAWVERRLREIFPEGLSSL